MIEYIYIVKCPECEDEQFYFFDDAKEFARGCMSRKPIINQIEVNRNDFGECTDSCDLGTQWSWEDECGPEDGCTDAEPAASVFTKDDLKPYENEEINDDDFFFNYGLVEEVTPTRFSFRNKEDFAEFTKLCKEIGIIDGKDLSKFMDEVGADDSNLLDKLREYRAELGDDFEITECARKPIPEGMTIEQLVEEMEENEDTVECAWCNELFDKDECRKEVDLGWLCGRCEAAIKSRGETLTFRENNYWDFLDEDYSGYSDMFSIIDMPEDGGKWYTVTNLTDGHVLKYICAKDEDTVSSELNWIIHDRALDPEDVYYEESSEEDFEEIEEFLSSQRVVDPTSSHFTMCPECGHESYDPKAGFCTSCGK